MKQIAADKPSMLKLAESQHFNPPRNASERCWLRKNTKRETRAFANYLLKCNARIVR